MTAVYRTFFGLSREPFGSDLRLKEILKTPALSAVQDRFEYTVRLGGCYLSRNNFEKIVKIYKIK